MVKLAVGGEYAASVVRRGEGTSEWEMLVVADENPKTHREIKVWSSTQTGIETGGKFRVERIKSVSAKPRKVGDKWREEVHVEADITPLMAFSQMPSTPAADDDELPF